jgi:hypothetical protein
MSEQLVVPQKMVIDGNPVDVTLIQNPIIDDVLVTEAEIQASAIWSSDSSLVSDRRVSRDIRDYLIRLGVER